MPQSMKALSKINQRILTGNNLLLLPHQNKVGGAGENKLQ